MWGKCAKATRCGPFAGGCVLVDEVRSNALDGDQPELNRGRTYRKMSPLYKPAMLHRAMALAFAVVVAVSPVSSGWSSALAAPSSVPSITDPRYFVGVNVPWFNWACDFGCADKGVSSPAVYGALAEGFGRLKAADVHAVRWWTFEGDPAQIMRDASGAPSGLNPAVYADFDAALALADEFDLAYDFVLFSGPTALPRSWITDPIQREQLANVLAPLFE